MPLGQAVFRLWQPWVTVGVIGALLNADGKVLIVEHVYHPTHPWGLPGGWMQRGEEPERTIQREMLEETGLHIQVIKPLLIARTQYLPAHLDMAYLCRLPEKLSASADGSNDSIHLSSELLAYQWIDPSDTDGPPMANFHRRVLREALKDC